MNIKAEEISKIIREQIGSYAVEVDVAEVGSVVSLGDGIARVHGVERAGQIPAPLGKLIVVLAEKDRLTLLPGIARAYGDRVMDHLKIVRGEVVTAVPLSPDTLRRLEQGLATATGRQVTLAARVDPSIIGGVVTRLGSTVYDGSVTTHLQRMKQRLEESV